MRLTITTAAAFIFAAFTPAVRGDIIVFEANGANPAAITPTRDTFRASVGGGTVAGANGSFGGLRREINWDGVPDASSDPNNLSGNFFNFNSPRGVVFSTPGTGFLVSANAGGSTPPLFGFSSDFQAFSLQKLFTAVNSNITDVSFFVPGTNTTATTNAFGVIFVDVEVANLTRVQFFDGNNQLLFDRFVLAGGNQGLSFLGGVANAGERIGRVRITSGGNTIVANGQLGNPNDDVVVMDDFLYGEPLALTSVPAPPAVVLVGMGAGCVTLRRYVHRRATA
jgi:hypothetical protein